MKNTVIKNKKLFVDENYIDFYQQKKEIFKVTVGDVTLKIVGAPSTYGFSCEKYSKYKAVFFIKESKLCYVTKHSFDSHEEAQSFFMGALKALQSASSIDEARIPVPRHEPQFVLYQQSPPRGRLHKFIWKEDQLVLERL